jgi:hypothetical protein
MPRDAAGVGAARLGIRAGRFAALETFRVARFVLRAVLRAFLATRRAPRRADLRADVARLATFLRAPLRRAERRLPRVERRRAGLRDFFLAAM